MYMTSKEMASQYVANGGVPGRTSTLMDPEFQAKNPSASAQLEAYAQADELLKRNLHWIPPTPVLGKILDRVGYWGTLPLTEGKSYEEVLKSADEEVNAILAEANK
jgi:ABC-type glycerol-3-phosphate transport system substrate-binding protein